MADLQFVAFALVRGRVRNEKQFGLPDDFSKIDVAIFSRTSHPASGFPAVFHNTVGPLFGDLQNVLHNGGKARTHEKFQHFRFQR